MKTTAMWRVFVAGSAAAILACDTTSITRVSPAEELATRSALELPAFAKPLACPTNDSFSSTSMVGLDGGIVTAGGTSISIPAGALLEPVTVTVTVPASNYMEIDVSVAGVEHFVFEQPVAVTVSYARCTRNDLNAKSLGAWYYDASTRTLIEPMPSVDNKLARTVTFTTGHLSGYILAN